MADRDTASENEETKDHLAPLREAFQQLQSEGKIHVNPLNPPDANDQFRQAVEELQKEIREMIERGEIVICAD